MNKLPPRKTPLLPLSPPTAFGTCPLPFGFPARNKAGRWRQFWHKSGGWQRPYVQCKPSTQSNCPSKTTPPTHQPINQFIYLFIRQFVHPCIQPTTRAARFFAHASRHPLLAGQQRGYFRSRVLTGETNLKMTPCSLEIGSSFLRLPPFWFKGKPRDHQFFGGLQKTVLGLLLFYFHGALSEQLPTIECASQIMLPPFWPPFNTIQKNTLKKVHSNPCTPQRPPSVRALNRLGDLGLLEKSTAIL